MEKTEIKLAPLQAAVANNIHNFIREQVEFIEKQEKVVMNTLLTSSTTGIRGSNGYDLRQNVQALESGKSTLSALKASFESYVGIKYDDYCDSIKVDKVTTPEERLLQAIKDIFK